ncbi:MAG: CehA/McbA family metallohydrolase [Tepidisphaeraceae bacterium]
MRFEHPYTNVDWSQPSRWLRGNLHAHTTQSDGKCTLQTVVDDYARLGYDFLSISDHDVYTGPAKHAELRNAANKNLILIPGNEVTALGPHMLHVGCESRVEPRAQRQPVIDDATTSCGFIVMNHPNWEQSFNHCPLETLDALTGYAGMEIYNGVIGRLDGSPYATNKWDILLSRGRKIWGFANDDSHCDTDVELGWNVAYATERTPAAVIDALANGRFYPSTGVRICRIDVDGPRVRVETENADRIVALRNTGCRIKQVDGNTIDVELAADDTYTTYLRFECWGRGEQVAWTQPFIVARYRRVRHPHEPLAQDPDLDEGHLVRAGAALLFCVLADEHGAGAREDLVLAEDRADDPAVVAGVGHAPDRRAGGDPGADDLDDRPPDHGPARPQSFRAPRARDFGDEGQGVDAPDQARAQREPRPRAPAPLRPRHLAARAGHRGLGALRMK